MIKKTVLTILLFTLPIIVPTLAFADQRTDNLKAAFIRNDDLLVKIGNKERKLTNGEYVRYPKWSHDGNWIAYLKRSKSGEVPLIDGELWLYNRKMDNHIKIKANVNHNFQWAPRDNRVSFLVNKDLYVLNLDPAIPFIVTKTAANIENFSWLPDGSGLITSAKESEQLHSNIILAKITFERHKPIVKSFFTIPVGEDEFFVSTSQFKWSSDQKWLSFLLIPTASLSADGNTLCLLSQDRQDFKRVDEMLKYEEWVQWAPTKGVLGYINGVGREAIKNKQLKTVSVPAFHTRGYTSMGYADRDLFWKNNNKIYVSRSKESELVEVNKRPLPSIYGVNILTNKQHQVTFPSKNEGDFAPKFIGSHLVWVRTDRQKANIFVSKKNSNEMKEEQWIKNITVGTWYYEKWNWDEVFSLYKPNSFKIKQ
jgi:hypothetical protein